MPAVDELVEGNGAEGDDYEDEDYEDEDQDVNGGRGGQLRPRAVAKMLKRQARKLNSNVRRGAEMLREEFEQR